MSTRVAANSMSSVNKMNENKHGALRPTSSGLNSASPLGSMTINGKLVGPSVRQITNLREQKR